MAVVTSIDLPALPVLLASIGTRARSGKPTVLELPNDDRLIDFLEAWQFIQALDQWTGGQADESIGPRTVSRLKERDQTCHKNMYIGGQYLPPHSLPLTRVSVDPARPLHAAAREREKWLRGPVQNVLRIVIGKLASKFVARAVIFEGIKNTAKHSGAELVYCTAEVQYAGSASREEFVVCIWDDGASITETLREGYRAHKKITTPVYGRIIEHFDIEVRERGTASYTYTLSNEDGIPPELEDELALMVSAFFFGVSADPTPRSDDELPDPEIGDHVAALGVAGSEMYGGVGTYLITDTVVYQCGGTVEYYNGRYRLTFTSAGPPDRYHVLAEIEPEDSVGVLGNLLVARLPGISIGMKQ
jgi:anti-sigma regulatory factor (Ser/Thr protein kinase)